MLQKVIYFILATSFLYSLMEISEDKYTIIFPKEDIDKAKETANMLENYIPLYNKYYNYELNGKVTFVINRSNKQKPDGYAFFNDIHKYASNSILRYDLYSSNEWGKLLVAHELSHSYQGISLRMPINRIIFKIYYSLLNPNIMMPFPFKEGNSILMESLANNEGRLHSGYSKALLNSQIHNDKLTSNSMILNMREFPYWETRYLIGGFFMKYLHGRYGLDMVNDYFISHSRFYMTSFALSFSEHFKSDFESVFNDFKKYYKTNIFTESKGELIAKSDLPIDLNKQNDEIYFTTAKIYNRSILNTFNTKTSKLDKRKSNFFNARAFKINNKFYFASSADINNERFYGLYDADFNRLKDSKSKIFTYISNTGKDKYYFDVNDSFNKLKLYKNDIFIDEIDSSQIVVDDGDLYYFKNIDGKRWLIKNNNKLFSLTGNYAFVVDKDESYIYFISSSNNGSSLFAWNKKSKEITRVFKGDDIYNAKKIDDDSFLISIVSSDSHKILKAKSLYFKESIVRVVEPKIYENKVKYKNKDFKVGSYSPWASMNVSPGYLTNKSMAFVAFDTTKEIVINGDFSFDGNHTLEYKNDSNEDFKHTAVSTISKQSEVLLFKFLYENRAYRKGKKYLDLALGYEYLDKRKDKDSLVFSLKYSDKLLNLLDSSPSRGYDSSLYLNQIISDGVNIKSDIKFYKKINNGLFLSANINGAFSTSKISKNKILIENNDIQNEHIKADNYTGTTFNDWIVKTKLKIEYVKYSTLYSRYFPSLVKSGLLISSSNFQSANNSFNENVFGIKATFLLLHEYEVDFLVKIINNSIYGETYGFKVSATLQ